jgi:hypothetical protein
MPNLIKSQGNLTEFNPAKVRGTLQRAGATPEVIAAVLRAVEARIVDGMTTKELFSIIRSELKRADRPTAQRYNLRDGLLRLGPAGFRFEQYVAAVLSAYQYETVIPEHDLVGLCVNHEIDVVARKDGKTVMIEAKFRNRFGDSVNLKDVMSTWARFGDLLDGAAAGKCERFDECWVVTNGRFSESALQFGTCKGMHLVGWGPGEHSFARLVDHAFVYPITVLDYLRLYEIEKLSDAGLMLCSDVAGRDAAALAEDLRLDPARVRRMVTDCRRLVAIPK